eukprot:CAMPEP_0118869564 /NCGR_PEP_ID=MMETSP1163-20130328/12861_1 /TAXON_ID=124430 /ORGANISM="Phaeomonas parva, Strain CCMP2877" /LENGTH=61 /DNA_ID=CAMNT_0006804469 /DNA_START=142 /DNA_END=324 /DNA_ORIENTATION=-
MRYQTSYLHEASASVVLAGGLALGVEYTRPVAALELGLGVHVDLHLDYVAGHAAAEGAELR